MQTRCISCGDLIAGVAQFCDACQTRMDEGADATRPAMPTPAPAQESAPEPGAALDLAFFAVVGAVVAGVAVWLLALGGAESIGLSGGDDEQRPQAANATDTQTPEPSVAPIGYVTSECEFEAPLTAEPECGQLTVPLDREQPERGTVTLAVAVFKSTSSERRPDPLIYLDGGPGGDTLEGIEFLYPALETLAESRDLIIFDQRGAGSSTPSLDCPEVNEINYDHLIRQFSVDERVAQDAASVRRCYERIVVSGVDPGLASSAESAADVNDLRLALGYEQLNLYGVSYGTKLALTIMRDYPEAVRSAVLDSVYPLQSDLYAELQPDFDRALATLFAECAEDPQCNATYPALEEAFYDTVDRLNEVPVQFSIGAFTGRPAETATIDGVLFSAFIFQSLYSAELIPLLPKMIFDTRDHNYLILKIVADVYLQDIDSVSQGVHLSVQCSEETPFADRDAILTAAESHPRLAHFSEYSAGSLFAACDEWQVPAAAATENEPVMSPIPSLVLAGQFDPITPPAWGRLAAEGLENSFFYEFPAIGHGVALSDDCATTIVRAFLTGPLQKPDGTCIEALDGPLWLIE